MTGETTVGERPAVETSRAWAIGRFSPHIAGVGALAAVAASCYALLGLVRLHTFRASTFDLVIFDQVVRAYSRFAPPYSPVIGSFRDRGLDYLQLADHFSPIHAVTAPLYWVHDGPETLIVAQAALFAAAVPFLWRYARRLLGTLPAYLVAVAYTLSWPIAHAARFDVHEVMFVPVLTAILIERFHAGRHPTAFLAMFGLLLVKEDMGLMVIGFGVYLFVTGHRRYGASFALIGAGWTVMVLGVLIPMAGGDTRDYWAYGHLGEGVSAVLGTALSDPLRVLGLMVNDEIKVDTLILLAWPTLMLCLLSPLTLAALPHLAVRMLADRPLWWEADFHYNAFVVIILCCAGVDGLARLLRLLGRAGTSRDAASIRLSWAVAVCAVAVTLLPRAGLDELVRPDFYGRDARAQAAAQAVAAVPSGVLVETVNPVGPALTARATVLLWDHQARMAPWVVADVEQLQFPFGSLEQQRDRVAALRSLGYQTVFERAGYIVLHRP